MTALTDCQDEESLHDFPSDHTDIGWGGPAWESGHFLFIFMIKICINVNLIAFDCCAFLFLQQVLLVDSRGVCGDVSLVLWVRKRDFKTDLYPKKGNFSAHKIIEKYMQLLNWEDGMRSRFCIEESFHVVCSYAFQDQLDLNLSHKNCPCMKKCFSSCPELSLVSKLRRSRGREENRERCLCMNSNFVRLFVSQYWLSIFKQTNYKWQ